MKIIAKQWFTPLGANFPIGIVVTKMDDAELQRWDLDGPIAAWIGLATPGTDELIDASNIATTGARFPLKAAEALFGKLEDLPATEPKVLLKLAPGVVHYGKRDMEVCVPKDWTDSQVVAFANNANPINAETGWYISPTPEVISCETRVDFKHVNLIVH